MRSNRPRRVPQPQRHAPIRLGVSAPLWPFHFSEREFESLIDGMVEFHFASAHLEAKVVAEYNRSFTAAGTIRTASGVFAARLPLVSTQHDVKAIYRVPDPSRVLADDELMRFTGTDHNAREWRADNLVVSVWGADGCRFALFETDALSTSAAPRFRGDRFLLGIGSELEFEANNPVQFHQRDSAGGEAVGVSFHSARFGAGSLNCHLILLPGATVFEASGERGSITGRDTVALCDALTIVTATPLQCCLHAVTCSGTEQITIRPKGPAAQPTRVCPPLMNIRGDRMWQLFDLCYRFAKDEHDDQTRLAEVLMMIVDSGREPLDVHGLVLGACIESLLDRVDPTIGTVEAKMPSWIDLLTAACRGVTTVPDAVQTRVVGALGGFKKRRATDCLRALQAQGIISHDQLKSFMEVRNSAAHGQFNVGRPDEHLKHCNRLVGLAYRLLFVLVGYKGPYTNFAADGFPQEDFPPTTSPSSAAGSA